VNDSVFIIILNWNGWEDTLECIESIYKINDTAFRIVIVENGSSNNSLFHIRDWYDSRGLSLVEYDRHVAEKGGRDIEEQILGLEASQAKAVLINTGENLGFSGGNNVGLNYALHIKPDYVWMLNNDTIVESSTLSHLTKSFNGDKAIHGVSPRINYYDNHGVIWNAGCNITWYGRLKRIKEHSLEKSGVNSVYNVNYITHCASLYPISTIAKVGLLSEKIFMGEDDYDYSHRTRQHHLQLAVNTSSIVYHKVGGSAGALSNAQNVQTWYVEFYLRLLSIKGHYTRAIFYLWLMLNIIRLIKKMSSHKNIKISEKFRILLKLIKDSRKNSGCTKKEYLELRKSIL
jgi:GT2 family glycosyltransferase